MNATKALCLIAVLGVLLVAGGLYWEYHQPPRISRQLEPHLAPILAPLDATSGRVATGSLFELREKIASGSSAEKTSALELCDGMLKAARERDSFVERLERPETAASGKLTVASLNVRNHDYFAQRTKEAWQLRANQWRPYLNRVLAAVKSQEPHRSFLAADEEKFAAPQVMTLQEVKDSQLPESHSPRTGTGKTGGPGRAIIYSPTTGQGVTSYR